MPGRNSLAGVTVVLLMLAACSSQPSFDADTWVRSVEEWRTARQDRLREPDSWLTLVGLYWLEKGPNTFGSGTDNDIVFPRSAPSRLGVIHYDDGGFRLASAPGAGMTVDGRSVAAAALSTDHDDANTIMQWGSLEWYLIERQDQVGLRLKDSLAAARLAFEGLDYYEIDASWRVEARFEPYDPPRTIPVPTILGTVSDSPSPGEVVFERDGTEYRLQAVADEDDNKYFLIFADETNGTETYGGGRFLYADAADESGRVVVDFNKAYSPPCVFSPYATCPLPPPGNSIALAIEAGEKMYEEGVRH